MQLSWIQAGDDLAARYENIVFRLHKDFLRINISHSSDKLEVQVFELQYRKLDNLDFKTLGYTFFVSNLDYGIPKIKSVDEKLWNKNKIEEIIERTEDILLSLHYISIPNIETK